MTHVVPSQLVDDHEADSELRALLSEARSASVVSDADIARFTAKLAPFVGVSLIGSAAPGAAGLAPAAPLAPAPMAGLTGQALLGQGAATAKLATGLGALKVGIASVAVGASLWLAHGALQKPAVVVSKPVAAVSAAPVALPAPQPTVEAQPLAPVVTAPVVTAAEPSVRRRKPERRAELKPASEAPDELGLIRDAQAARREPERALSLLAQHQKFYPTGLLSQEREVLAVEALLAAGRRPEAEKRASVFFRSFPGSVHAARLRSMLQAPLAD